MAAWKYPGSTSSASWPAIDLGTDYSVYVGIGVYISADVVSGSTILGSGIAQQVIIDGSVAGSNAIDLRGGYSTDVGDFVRVSEGAKIFADSRGIIIEGFNNRIQNDGVIESGHSGIDIDGESTTGDSKIINSGEIFADQYAIYARNGTQAITLDNSGTIKGAYVSFWGGDGADSVINSGLMQGVVVLGSGGDLYDGRKGRVPISTNPGYPGSVEGDEGNDKIYGGSAKEAFDGGAGFDRISGGKGGDLLTGGADGDTFAYNAVADSTVKASGRDTIADFEHLADRIDLSHLHPGTKSDQFRFVDHNALKHAGDLHFVLHDNAGAANDFTMVEGTVDAGPKADFQIELTGLITLTRDDFVL
jgi:Ca2+-binding RTX toxin-like protein